MQETKEIYGIIYIIRNKINNKLYIGQTAEERGFYGRYGFSGVGIERVYKYHLSNKKLNKTHNKHLLNSIKKYGFDAFEVDEEFDIAYSKEELDKLEDLYIKVYNTVNKDYGYNNKYGGANGKHIEETKQRLRDMNLGENNPMYWKHWTEEKKNARTEAIKGENNPFYGKRHTQESKNKMSESHSGKNHPLFGKSMPQETKRKIGEANKGKKRSQESRRNISEAHKGKQVGKDNPKAKAVYCEELKEIRLTMKEWAEELGINRSHISFCCSGKVKSAKGYHFRYATEEEIEEYKIKHEYKGSDL